jgi:hypothetical protein
MLTFEDSSERERFPVEGGTLEQSVRRVVGLTVLDLATGKELLPRLAQDVRLDGHAAQPIEFDGERIRYWLHRGPDDPCTGARLQTLALNAAANAVSSRERCEADPKPLSEATGDGGTGSGRCYMSGRGGEARTRELPGGSVTLGGLGDATLVDVKAGAHRWLVGIPTDLGLSPELGNVRQDGDIIFLESQSWTVGRLDALDAVGERPLWTYVFPSTPQVGSWSSFLPKPEPEKMTFGEPGWAEIRRSPPSGVFPVPLEVVAERSAATRARDRHLDRSGAAPVILDPARPRRGPAKSAALEP